MAKKQKTTVGPFNHDAGLITFDDGKYCLGFLMHFEAHGVFDATYGKVDVPPDQVDTHNSVLSRLQIEGLDNNCAIGQGGTFYVNTAAAGKQLRVQTFTGDLVAFATARVTPNGKRTLHFVRNEKHYKGLIRKDSDLFAFRRVS